MTSPDLVVLAASQLPFAPKHALRDPLLCWPPSPPPTPSLALAPSMFGGYSHFQPQPQPVQLQGVHSQPYPQPYSHSYLHPFPHAKPQPAPSAVPPASHSSSSASPFPPPFAALPPHMGVGHGADFELFGAPPSPVRHQSAAPPSSQPQHLPYRPCPPALAPRSAPLPQYAGGYAISIPPSSSSSDASSLGGDYPPLPDLVADEGTSTASFSPPSPRFLSAIRPGMLDHGAPGGGAGSTRGGGERASSVPAPDAPRLMRRKTQESRDWPSFYSSGSSSTSSSMSSNAYLPTPQLGAQQQLQPAFTDEPASYATPHAATANASNPFDLALSPAPQYRFSPSASTRTDARGVAAPHPDHPLLPSEQSDLLDRVRRDLCDVDLSSIKGPLRALALSGGDREKTPTDSLPQHRSPPTPQQPPLVPPAQITPKAALLRSPGIANDDALSAGTVSPQDAFLDYDAVDSRMHDPADPLYAPPGRDRDFGVGVGGSLFAPLPGATYPSPSPLNAAAPSSAAPSAASIRASPSPAAAAATTRDRSATPTAAASTAGSHAHHHPKRPHPFSVPQNAVTWAERRSRSGRHLVGGVVDGDADDDDGDFEGEEEEDESVEDDEDARVKEGLRRQARLGSGFGRFDKKDLDLKPGAAAQPSDEERARYGLDDVGKPLFGTTAPLQAAVKGEDPGADEIKPFAFAPSGAVSGKSLPFAPALPPQQQQQQFGFAAPRHSTTTTPAGVSAFHEELHKQQLAKAAALAGSTSASGTSTPQRAAAASALAGLHALGGSPGSMPAPLPEQSEAPAQPQQVPTRPVRQRKRSRAARAMYGESDDDYEDGSAGATAGAAGRSRRGGGTGTGGTTTGEEDDAGHESDASYHSSASSFAGTGRAGGGGGPAPKRRRRAPNAGGSAGGSRSGQPVAGGIRCEHVNADGSQCGVVFRRPYDLARHKETIHGEGLGGQKVKVKEWRCEECGGTFSCVSCSLLNSLFAILKPRPCFPQPQGRAPPPRPHPQPPRPVIPAQHRRHL